MMAATLHPEVIIVDMAMPGHNDCGLCRRIVGDPVTAYVKVLGLVDSLSEEEGERSWRRGVTELLASWGDRVARQTAGRPGRLPACMLDAGGQILTLHECSRLWGTG